MSTKRLIETARQEIDEFLLKEEGDQLFVKQFEAYLSESKRVGEDQDLNGIEPGLKVRYKGKAYTVTSSNGFRLELEDSDGNTVRVNRAQFKTGGEH